MSATVLYSAQVNREALKKWAGRIPREVGGAIIAEAVSDLMHGDSSSLKSLPFVSRCNLRRKHRARVAVTRPAPVKTEKLLRIPVLRETMKRLEALARSRGQSVPDFAAAALLAAPIFLTGSAARGKEPS